MDCKIGSVQIDQFISRNNPRYLELVNYIIQVGPTAVKASKTGEQLVAYLEDKLKVFGPQYRLQVEDYYGQPIDVAYSEIVTVRVDDSTRPKYLH